MKRHFSKCTRYRHAIVYDLPNIECRIRVSVRVTVSMVSVRVGVRVRVRVGGLGLELGAARIECENLNAAVKMCRGAIGQSRQDRRSGIGFGSGYSHPKARVKVI